MSDTTDPKTRTCSICQKSGHNSRTCDMRPKNAEGVSDSETVSASAGNSLIQSANPGQPSSFTESTIQENSNGLTYRATIREYSTGNTKIFLKIAGGQAKPQEFQFDVSGAVTVNRLLASLLQRHAAEQQKKAPVARITSNGHAKPHTETTPALEAQQ